MPLSSGVIENFALATNSNGSIGTYNGTDTSITYGSGAANFSGSPSYINAGAFTELQSIQNFSLSLIFNATSVSDYYLVSKWIYPTQNTFALRLLSTGAGFLYIGSSPSDTGSNGFTIPFNYSAGVYNHILITFDGTQALDINKCQVYFNGSAVTLLVIGAIASTLSAGTSPLNLGTVLPGYDYFNGALKQVCIWNRTLSSLEAADLWNGGAVKQYPFGAPVISNSNFFQFF